MSSARSLRRRIKRRVDDLESQIEAELEATSKSFDNEAVHSQAAIHETGGK